jgi:tetratricopeptide (TPR) repeat protein
MSPLADSAADAFSVQPPASRLEGEPSEPSPSYAFDETSDNATSSIMAFPPLVAPERADSTDADSAAEAIELIPPQSSFQAIGRGGWGEEPSRATTPQAEYEPGAGERAVESDGAAFEGTGREWPLDDLFGSRALPPSNAATSNGELFSSAASTAEAMGPQVVENGLVAKQRDDETWPRSASNAASAGGMSDTARSRPMDDRTQSGLRGAVQADSPSVVSPDVSEFGYDAQDIDVTPAPRLPDGVAQQARQYINAGIQQAERGAVYSARAQFIKVLRLTTQSFDAATQSNRYSSALAAGLRALEESSDFRPSGSQLEGNLNLVNILQTHQTPVLKQVDPASLTPLSAARAYHGYAERQLALAAGEELVAADAYYGLAKLQNHLDVGRPDRDRHNGPIAMSYYQAALIVYPEHYLAANELGVLFARFGQLEDAREVLRFALTLNRDAPELWLNLSRVHERLGEADLAERAEGEYRHAAQLANRSMPEHANRGAVEWLDAASFSRVGGEREQMLPTETARRVQSTASPNGRTDEFPMAAETAKQKPSRGIWPFR